MADQRVELQRAQQKVSRPLRTGAGFVLVVPAARLMAGHWDKVAYQAGDECRLSVLGAGLGKEPLTLTVEAEGERGGWSAVAKVCAEVDAGQKEATASWRFPPAAVVPGAATVREADGSRLSEARFEDHRDLRPGGTAWLRARAEGFEGTRMQVVLEREESPGNWIAVGQAVATVNSGALRAAVTPSTNTKSPAR
jgi:hypothetical protein